MTVQQLFFAVVSSQIRDVIIMRTGLQ